MPDQRLSYVAFAGRVCYAFRALIFGCSGVETVGCTGATQMPDPSDEVQLEVVENATKTGEPCMVLQR